MFSTLPEYFRRSFALVTSKELRKAYFFLGLFPVALSFTLSFVLGIMRDTGLLVQNVESFLLLTIVTLIAIGLSLWYTATLFFTNYHVATNQPISLTQEISFGRQALVRTFLAFLAFGMVVALGTIAIVVPGILFFFWFLFAPMIVILENKKIKDAFSESHALVKSRLWSVVWKLLLLYVTYALPQFVLNKISPTAGTLWNFTSPFYNLVFIFFFLELKARQQTQ